MAALHKLRQQYLRLEKSESRNQRGRQKTLWDAALRIMTSLETARWNESSQTRQSLSTIRVQLEEAVEVIDGWMADL